MDKIPLTKDGEKTLQEELRNLKLERPKISKAIAEAREHGDLKENAEYHAAREQQSLTEAKIKDIEYKLSNSEIIDSKSSENEDQIIFGSFVELLNTENNSKIKYQLVGEDEADLKKNKISFNSPVAKGLINKKVGDALAGDKSSHGEYNDNKLRVRHAYYSYVLWFFIVIVMTCGIAAISAGVAMPASRPLQGLILIVALGLGYFLLTRIWSEYQKLLRRVGAS